MNFTKDKIETKKNMEELVTKLQALDLLMQTNALLGSFKNTNNNTIENYCRSNPFTNNNNRV